MQNSRRRLVALATAASLSLSLATVPAVSAQETATPNVDASPAQPAEQLDVEEVAPIQPNAADAAPADVAPAQPEAAQPAPAQPSAASPAAKPTRSQNSESRTAEKRTSGSRFSRSSNSNSQPTDIGRTLLYEFSQLPFISISLLRVLGGVFGSQSNRLLKDFQQPPENFPYPIDTSITSVSLVSREPATIYPRSEERRLERWTVASPSMGRNITVDVRLPQPTGEPAPTLVMLDGLPAPTYSGWLREWSGTDFDRVLGDENVTVVFPLDAEATWYTDWVNDDPVLGRQKWETFITKEFLPLLDAQPDINSNGKRAIAGLSMGATGAMNIANRHPDKFNAVVGLSGYYSTMDTNGRQAMQFVPGSRGANVDNMWGPYGSTEWRSHDITLNPHGLRNLTVYLVAATGGLYLNQYYSDATTRGLAMGSAMEVLAYESTQKLDKAMKKAGMRHQKVVYRDRGTHNWEIFRVELEDAWAHIRPALF